MFLLLGYLIYQQEAYLAGLIWEEDQAIYQEICDSADIGHIRYNKSDMLWEVQQGHIEINSDDEEDLEAEVDALDRQLEW